MGALNLVHTKHVFFTGHEVPYPLHKNKGYLREILHAEP